VTDGFAAEGLLLEPKGKVIASVVAIPDADQTPESGNIRFPAPPPRLAKTVDASFLSNVFQNGV
jgi:hypothetical protein